MKRSELPRTIPLLLNEVNTQEQRDRREKIIVYVDDARSEILQIGLKDNKRIGYYFKFFLDKLNTLPSIYTIL